MSYCFVILEKFSTVIFVSYQYWWVVVSCNTGLEELSKNHFHLIVSFLFLKNAPYLAHDQVRISNTWLSSSHPNFMLEGWYNYLSQTVYLTLKVALNVAQTLLQAVSSEKCSKWSRLQPINLGNGESIQTRGTEAISNLGTVGLNLFKVIFINLGNGESIQTRGPERISNLGLS